MKRSLSLLLALVAALQLLTSCATQPEVPAETDETQPAETQPVETQYIETDVPAEILLSEVMADNQKLCLGHTLDWVELYNAESDPVELDGYYLTDDPGKPEKMSLAGRQIDSGEYLTVELDEEAPFHLSAVGGTVYLTCQGEVLSELTFGITEFGESFDQNGICDYPSPGFANTEDGYYAYLEEQDLPVLTVEISQQHLTGTAGVLNNIEKSYEYEAMMTLIEDGEEKFSIPMGFRLHGNDSRKGAKQNFQVRFRSEYGASKLDYPLFENRSFTEYHSLLLKGGSEDFTRAMMRDELATAVPDGTTNLYTQAIKPVVLYLGGNYWGIYYIRERLCEEYVASHLGVSAESVDILESSAGYVESGDRTEYTALLRYVASHDMSKAEHYTYLTEQVDILSLMDWYICRSYMGDVDLANVRRFRSDEGDGKWRWMYYDLDWGWYNSSNPFSKIVNMYGGDRTLMQAALESKEGREAFLVRYNYLLDTILNDEYINSVIDKLENAILSEIPRDRARWKQTVSGWENSVQALRQFDKDGRRTQRILSNLQSYFHLSDEEMEFYFGQ